MKNPYVRLAVRALVVAAGSLVVQLQASDRLDSSVLRAALLGAALAGLEVLTPLNPSVGPAAK